MKILEAYKQLLTEILSPEEFHYTYNIYDIISTDQINLSSGLGGRGADQKGNKFFFLSLSRTGSFKLGFKRGQTSVARIVFDGRKLNNNFQSLPVDYWGNKEDPQFAASFEYEDRLVTDKPVINGINKYILRVEIITDRENNYPMFKKILGICDSKGIPCLIYGNETDLRLKRNPLNDKIAGVEDTEPYETYDRGMDMTKVVALLMFNKKYLDNYDIFKSELAEYLSANNLPEVDAYKTYDVMRGLSWGNRDFLSDIGADFHNYFKGGKGGRFRKDVELLVRDMRRNKVNNLEELVNIRVNGIKPQTKLDWTQKFCLLEADYNPETQKNDIYVPVDNGKEFSKVYGFNYQSYKYGGYLRDDDFTVAWDLDKRGGTIGEFLNYLLNKYTIDKVSEIVYGTGHDSYDKTFRYKLGKVGM